MQTSHTDRVVFLYTPSVATTLDIAICHASAEFQNRKERLCARRVLSRFLNILCNELTRLKMQNSCHSRYLAGTIGRLQEPADLQLSERLLYNHTWAHRS